MIQLILYNSRLWRHTKIGHILITSNKFIRVEYLENKPLYRKLLRQIVLIRIAIPDYDSRIKWSNKLFPTKMNLTSPIGFNWFSIQFPKNKPLYYEFLNQFQPGE